MSTSSEYSSSFFFFFCGRSFSFARGTLQEFQSIKHVLQMYELASGQAMNFEKSCVSFTNYLSTFDEQLLVDCLGVKRVKFHDRYLGLPILIRRSKKDTFSYVKDRLWNKLQSWRGGLLSCAGKIC